MIRKKKLEEWLMELESHPFLAKKMELKKEEEDLEFRLSVLEATYYNAHTKPKIIKDMHDRIHDVRVKIRDVNTRINEERLDEIISVVRGELEKLK
ncbi:hypothetical protein EDD73_11528 [Heliophilum fasciatum]|uniref:Uncharacterized protein n=2 Tax=Heliophilum fasciatum TaxID=35700 RepID=A0A4R2RIZ2_9FIRM|nr:hypothetical protein EDD73_11528 [Heliophilum fasciatum]